MIYLDYAANTPVDEEVLDCFVEATKKYIANPNSSHNLGIQAKEKIDESSEIIASYFKTTKESVIYTSGASESNNLVLKGITENSDKKHIIISSIEHSSIISPANYLLNKGYDVSIIGLTSDGTVDLEELKNEINDNTCLVSICSVDSEAGIIQPIKEIANIVKKYPNCVFHTDATQAIGKVDLPFYEADLITFAPHKFFGLNGFGVLINRGNIKLNPQIHGGKSTTNYRSGTPVTANVIALEKAFTKALDNMEYRNTYSKELKEYLTSELTKLDYIHINSPKDSINTTLNFSIINKDKQLLLNKLNDKEIYLSTTSACSLDNMPSRTVMALTNNKDLALNTFRISLSHLVTKEEINELLEIIREI